MSVVRFEINFNKSPASYFCGETVNGTIIIELEKERKIRAIQLKIVGKAGIPIKSELSKAGNNYNEIEIFKQYSTDFSGVPSNTILPPGTHRYSFGFVLPLAIPSTYSNESGYVRYQVKAAIRRELIDNKCESSIEVKCPLDLNTISGLTIPVHASTTKMINYGLRDYPLMLEIYLPFSGYVSNQNVHADFVFKNQSRSRVYLKAYIVQITEYRTNAGRLQVDRNVICRQRVADIHSQGSLTSSTDIQVPDIQDTFIDRSKRFSSSYWFEMKAKVLGTNQEVGIGLPIVVGSIPLKIDHDHRTKMGNHQYLTPINSEVPHPARARSRGASSAEFTSSVFSLPPPEMSPPPTYEEAIGEMINDMTIDD